MVLQALKRMQRSYEDKFLGKIAKWTEIVEDSIQAAVTSKQRNQIRPKLEIVYTSLINQENDILKEIEKIGRALCSEEY